MKQPKFPENWPAPDEYLIELGRITALWGVLESTLDVAINKVSGFDDVMDYKCAILITHSNFNQRLDILSTFCDILVRNHDNLSDYKTVVGAIRSAQTKRNKYAHNAITLDPESNSVKVSYMSARGKLKTQTEEVKLSDLKQVSIDIHKAGIALLNLITKSDHKLIWE